MLKFFFQRSSPMVHLMNVLAACEAILLLLHGPLRGAGGRGLVSYFFIFSLIFFNALDWIRWYPGRGEKLGIRIHFKKNIVPISYLCVVVFTLKLGGISEGWILPLILFLLPIYYVSCILLYFHFRDSSELMPSYFSHNFYLKEKE